MELNLIVDNVIRRALQKFDVIRSEVNPNYRWRGTAENWQKTVLTLNRSTSTDVHARTVLVASGSPGAALDEIYRWCAHVKGSLMDPGTADLYLFVIYAEPIPDLDLCLQVEANEQFCRKYVLRPQEHFDDLLNRSFLSEPSRATAGQERSEPLKQALLETATSFPWLDEAEIESWRSILLSEGSGNELAQFLYQKSTNNE